MKAEEWFRKEYPLFNNQHMNPPGSWFEIFELMDEYALYKVHKKLASIISNFAHTIKNETPQNTD